MTAGTPVEAAQLWSMLDEMAARGLPRIIQRYARSLADLHAEDASLGLTPVAEVPIARLTVATYAEAVRWTHALRLPLPITEIRVLRSVVETVSLSRGMVGGWRLTVCSRDIKPYAEFASRLAVECGL
jgi:hypothetical protein